MKRLFKAVDDYAKTSTWKTFAFLKICMCSVGIMIGLALPKKHHKSAVFASVFLFTLSYLPLMIDFLPFLNKELSVTSIEA